MKIPALDTASDLGLRALRLQRSKNGELSFDSYSSNALEYHQQNHFEALVLRAQDSLPDGASGDKIIGRILAQNAVDKRFSELGRLGQGIPTNFNVWHHAPKLTLALRSVGEAIETEVN